LARRRDGHIADPPWRHSIPWRDAIARGEALSPRPIRNVLAAAKNSVLGENDRSLDVQDSACNPNSVRWFAPTHAPTRTESDPVELSLIIRLKESCRPLPITATHSLNIEVADNRTSIDRDVRRNRMILSGSAGPFREESEWRSDFLGFFSATGSHCRTA
jgi:hypothetical protein